MSVHEFGWNGILILIGIILMVLGSCGIPSGRVQLWNLGWAFVIAGIFFVGSGGTVLIR